MIDSPISATLSLWGAVGYRMPTPEGFPIARVALVVPHDDECREASMAVIREIAQREGWEAHNLDNPSSSAFSVACERSIAAFFNEEDHVASLKRFFMDGIEVLGDVLVSFNDRNPELSWDGGKRNKVRRLGSIVDTRQRQNTHQWYWRDPDQAVDVLVHDIKLADELPVAVGARLSDQGWEVKIFVRDGGDMEKLRALLRSIEIPFEEGERLSYPVRFSYGDPVEKIQPHLQEIVDKIAEATAAAEPRQTDQAGG